MWFVALKALGEQLIPSFGAAVLTLTLEDNDKCAHMIEIKTSVSWRTAANAGFNDADLIEMSFHIVFLNTKNK